jgi:hypothetical protein
MSEKDNTELKPAEENPWYVLATLYGEEPDEATQNKNRMAWNSWAVSKLNESDKQAIVLSNKDGLGEIKKWEGKNGFKEKAEELFKQRLPSEKFSQLEKTPIVEFSDTFFVNAVDMRDFIFPIRTSFKNSYFKEDVSFHGAFFYHMVSFGKKVTFAGKAEFIAVYFSDLVLFKEAKFYGDAHFGLVVFKDRSNFREAIFHSQSSFSECTFDMPCNFFATKFIQEFPEFVNMIFREKITLSIRQEDWPDTNNCEQNPEEAKVTCEILREQMEAQGFHEQAHFFFRREMQFASKIGSSIQRLPYKLFGLFSDYGHSIARPLSALAWLWALPMVIFWVNVCTGKCANTIGAELWVSLIKMAGLSIANIFQITGLQRVYWSDFIECLPWGLKFLGGAQTLLAIPLLFLLLLGLRNRFRLK